MLKSPQVNVRDLSKAGKIRLFEVFYDALEATRRIYLYEVKSLLKEMLKDNDKAKSINLGNFMISLYGVFTNSRKAIYEGYENGVVYLERYGEFDWESCIFKEMQNTEKIMSEVSANISPDDYNAIAKVLKEWETKNNYLVNRILKSA